MTVEEFYRYCQEHDITNYRIFIDKISLAGCFIGYEELTEKDINVGYGEKMITFM